MNRIPLLLVAAALSLPGCKKHAPIDNPDRSTSSSASQPEGPARDAAEAASQIAGNFRRIYFDFDSATLDAESKAALADNAALMQKFTSILVEVQGHADERGTVDYNVALGQRRAEAIRSYMVAMGVPAGRVKTVSYGEEAPLVTGHTEVAWAQNRRAEFRVLSGEEGIAGTTR